MKDTLKSYLETVCCNLCGSEEYDVVYPSRYDEFDGADFADKFKSSGDEILIDQLVKCRSCGLQYISPRLNSEKIIGGYSEGSDETFISQIEGRERTFKRCLENIEKAVPGKGRILDVGTAGGSFPGVARKAGWDVAACEPNRWLAEWGSRHYDIHITPGTLFDLKYEDGTFDVITLWDVLEHTPDPKAVLEECGRLLKQGGLLVVNYPDIGVSISRAMGRKWVFLLSVHLYYFTVETMRKMLERTGYQVVKSSKHWQTLELGYICKRIKPYASFLSDFGAGICRILRIEHMLVPYWMGQMLVYARKK